MVIENLLAAFELWGILICSGIGIYFFLVRKINNRADSVMCIMQFVAAATLTFDVGVVISEGVNEPWAKVVFQMSMLATMLLQYLMVALFVGYIKYLSRSGKVANIVAMISYFFAAICALICVISAKYTHWYYLIDEQNNYHRQSYYNLAIVLSGVLYALVVLQIIVCARRLMVRQIISLLLYVTIPFLFVVLQVVLKPGIGLLNIGMAISLIVIFIVNNVRITMMEKELNNKVLQQNMVLLTQNKVIAAKKEEIENLQLNMVITQMQNNFVYNVLNIIYYI